MMIGFICAVILIFLLYKYSTRNFKYWQKRGVPFTKPVPFFGNFLEVFLQRINIGFYLAKCYKNFDAPYFGIYILNKPYLVIKSPELIKRVLIQDFNTFCDRTMALNKEGDPIGSYTLFLAKNPDWQLMRSMVAPAYTPSKAKKMLALMDAVAEEMKKYVYERGLEFTMDAKKLTTKFTANIVASCGFGVNANCFESDTVQFELIADKVNNSKGKVGFGQMCYFLAPSLVKFFNIPFVDPTVAEFMREVVALAMKEREGAAPTRNDIIDIIMQIRKNSSPEDPIKFEGDIAVSQAFQFYAAGLDTTSSTIAFTLYEFCIHPEMQDRLRSEIKSVVTQHGGYTYEAIQDMTYLQMVVSETLRKYPALPFLDRMCMEDYKVPGSDLIIEKGTPVYIPMFGIHFDPQVFPEPEMYNPERFSKGKFSSCSYLPFGEGPRGCIGERIGIAMAKLGLVHLLSDVVVETCSETPIPIKYDPMGYLLNSTVGLPMKFRRNPLFTS